MLEEIRIDSLGVIGSSTLELGEGLTVITGETGAGKTMIVTALGLLLGGRADSGAVRTGARHARVEGTVATGRLPEFAAAVEEGTGGEVEDDRVVLGRTVSAEGRSRAFAGGASVPVGRLAELTRPLVAVHGQSDQHRLLQPQAQRSALDRYGGDAVAGPLQRYQQLYAAWRATGEELADVTTHARDRAREADLLRFGVGEIDAVAPAPGEDIELASEEARLGHADTLRLAAEAAREALSSDEDQPDALATTAAARAALDGVRDHDQQAAELADRVAELSYLLADLSADVSTYAAGVESDPARLAAVSERRAALSALTKKYGETVDEVLAWRDRAESRLVELDGTDERIDALRVEQERLHVELDRAATELSEARVTAADRLANDVTGELADLAMPHARVLVEVTGRERFGSSGRDDVELRLAANAGAEPRPLHKGASGGELSRVMLALEVTLAEGGTVPTFVFDEVDAGVGGAAAVEVGRRLARLARSAQVLVVTHLPQVAAYADRHVVVSKSSDGTITSSDLAVLDDAGRERELSRMMAGLADSDNALAHARELLEVAQAVRARA